ncbi:MAG: hypothetical protein KGI27_10910 [Thaumarchaeota archaeon]|nr:hypothetical protein [Nitrososphaerota archaeon]
MKTSHLAIIAISITMVSFLKSAYAACEEHLTLNPHAPVPNCITFISFDSTIITIVVVMIVIGVGFVVFRRLKENNIRK